jgi:hypothetical protein
LRQTGKISEFPVVLMGTDYWQGLLRWMEERLLPEKMINKRDFRMLRVTDDVDDVVRIIQRSYAKRQKIEGGRTANGGETP